MSLHKRVLLKFYKKIVILKITIGKWLGGIDYVSRQIASCPHFVISDLLNINGAFIGINVNFKDAIKIDNASGDEDAKGDFSNLFIDDNCYIGKGVFFDLPRKIVLKKDCVVSAGVKFLTHEDCGTRMMSKYYPRKVGDILIGEGSWIGTNAIILNGVSLGKMCVVGAGAVVTKSFPDYSVVVGVPARVVKILKKT